MPRKTYQHLLSEPESRCWFDNTAIAALACLSQSLTLPNKLFSFEDYINSKEKLNLYNIRLI
ncbi:MAG: hypothetical protein QXX95_06125 [Nitrososphaerales archaeon]